MDDLTVRVERRPDVSGDDAGVAGDRLATLVKNVVGVSVRVQVVEPETVARSNGKMIRVVDQRPAR